MGTERLATMWGWRAWQGWLRSGSVSAVAPPRRWVVVDVESTGLDVRTDRLVSIAAVAIHVSPVDGGCERLRISLADSFEVILRHDEPLEFSIEPPSERMKRNVLLHGIGLGAQASGVEPAQALNAFAAYVAGAPLIGYHSWFDQAMIERAFLSHCAQIPSWRWLDLEDVARGAHNEVRRMALDDWLARYDINCTVRHNAASDTLATAELLACLWHRIAKAEQPAWQIVQRVAGDARFLAGRV
jgi:DNA polymerase III subunit epsilon